MFKKDNPEHINAVKREQATLEKLQENIKNAQEELNTISKNKTNPDFSRYYTLGMERQKLEDQLSLSKRILNALNQHKDEPLAKNVTADQAPPSSLNQK